MSAVRRQTPAKGRTGTRGRSTPGKTRQAPPSPPPLGLAQHDLRTIRVEYLGTRILLRYGFVFDGHDRLPESVVLDGSQVRAFFLSTSVKDEIQEADGSLQIRRQWSVMQAGRARLAAVLEIPAWAVDRGNRTRGLVFRALFPGAWGGEPQAAPVSLRDERTALPAALVLATEERAIALHARCEQGDPVSISVATAADESGPVIRVTVELPPRERAPWGDDPGRRDEPGDGGLDEMASSGALTRSVILQISVAPPAEVYRVCLRPHVTTRAPRPHHPALRDLTRTFLGTHGVERGGVAGLRVVPGSDLLSASAAARTAVLLCRLYPEEPEQLERALRLAEFCLTARHAGGLFYERYSLRQGTWLGLRGARPDVAGRPPLCSVEESARIAAALLDLDTALTERGHPTTRFAAAARGFVDAFLDHRGVFSSPAAVMTPDGSIRAEEGMGALAYLFPLLGIMDRDRRERYRKAAEVLVRTWIDPTEALPALPSSREGRDPDSHAALLLAEAAVEAAGRGIAPANPETLSGLVLAWAAAGPGSAEGLPGPGGALLDSFLRPRWKPQPYRTAFLCLRLAPLCSASWRAVLEGLAEAALGQGGRFPPGTSYVRRTRWPQPEETGRGARKPCFEIGPVDARELAAELWSCHLLEREGRLG